MKNIDGFTSASDDMNDVVVLASTAAEQGRDVALLELATHDAPNNRFVFDNMSAYARNSEKPSANGAGSPATGA